MSVRMMQQRYEPPIELVMAYLLILAHEGRESGHMHPLVRQFLIAAGRLPPDLTAFELDADELARLCGSTP